MTTMSGNEAAAPPLPAGEWTVNPAQSKLRFKTRAMGLFPVTGTYSTFGGTLRVNHEGAASGQLHVDAAALSTGIGRRDKHLRSKDFFHAEAYPQMTFDLSRLSPAAAGPTQLIGTLHIRDRELPLDTPVTLTTVDPHGLRIDGSFEIDHHSAGFEFKRLPRRVQIDVELKLDPVR